MSCMTVEHRYVCQVLMATCNIVKVTENGVLQPEDY